MAKHVEKLRYDVCANIMEEYSMKSRKQNSPIRSSIDVDLYQKGELWFKNGFKLEEAPDELKNMRPFISGFERAKRLTIIEEHLYELGKQYFKNGIIPEDFPNAYKENTTVLKGYEDAKNSSRKK